MKSKIRKKVIPIILLVSLIFQSGIGVVYAEEGGTGPYTYDISQGPIIIEKGTGDTLKVTHGNNLVENNITAGTVFTLTGTSVGENSHNVIIQGGVTANITFNNLSITGEETVDILESSTMLLTLVGDNTLENIHQYDWVTSGIKGAALGVGQGNTLAITSESTGKLKANGAWGIGGRYDSSGGSVRIDGGSVIATGEYKAGISGDSVIIGGGIITATGGDGEAGIDGGSVTISGGTVTAYGSKMEGGGSAGIGAGFGGSGGTVIISGGTVIAKGSDGGAGIGGGVDGSGGSVTISGGIVTATGDNAGAGIGGGVGGSGGTVIISGGTVIATGDYGGAGIGGGRGASAHGSFISKDNAFVVASSIGNTAYMEKADSQGVIFINTDGQTYGNPSIATDAEIPTNSTLTIANDKSITVKSGVTLTNNGSLINNGAFILEGGTIEGNNLGGEGTFISLDDISITLSSDQYTGDVITPAITLSTKDILGKTFNSGITTEMLSFEKQLRTGEWETVTEIKDAGYYKLLYPKDLQKIILKQFRVVYVEEGAGAYTYDISQSSIIIEKGTVGDTLKVTYDGVRDKDNIDKDTIFTLTGTSVGENSHNLIIQGGVTANITFNNLSITGEETVDILESSTMLLTLVGDNTLENIHQYDWVTSGIKGAALGVGQGNTLAITSESTGKLKANGAWGIGGRYDGSGGSVRIDGGSVIATGEYKAGISGDSVIIGGGIITATGGDGEAGIDGGSVTISGGTVTAYGSKMEGGGSAGIGAGFGGSGGTVIISGGTVIAKGSDGGAGIGGGVDGSGGSVTISGGIVTATGDNAGAGIGGGVGGSGGTVIISGGTVIATGDYGGAGIGGGRGASAHGSFISKDNAFVVASSIGNTAYMEKADSQGVIFINTDGQTYGNPSIATDAEIPTNSTLTIANDKSITVKSGVTLTNNGSLINNGAFILEGGTIEGNNLGGEGTFISLDDISITLSSDQYTGDVITPAITLSTKDILGKTFNSGITTEMLSFEKQLRTGEWETVTEIKDAGYYKLLYPKDLQKIILKQFSITKATPTVTIEDWFYGSIKHPVPTYDGNETSDITYQYKAQGADDTTYTDIKPTDVGSYTLKAIFSETTNYTPATATADFTIKKAYDDGIGASLYGRSLSLSGNIGINLYMDLDPAAMAKYPGAYMLFTLPDGLTSQVKLTDASTKVIDEQTYYLFTCKVNAKQMGETVSSQIMWNNETPGKLYNHSVHEYVGDVIASTDPEISKSQDLVKAMRVYGHYSEAYFDNTEFVVNSEMQETVAKVNAVTSSAISLDLQASKTGTQAGISHYGSSLILDSETSIRHYFKLEVGKDISAFTFTLENVGSPANAGELQPVKKGDLYYVQIPNIAAHKLDTMYSVKVGGLEVKCSAISYVYLGLIDGDATGNEANGLAFQNLLKSLYVYNDEAKKYIIKIGGHYE